MSSTKMFGTVFQASYVGSQGRHLRLTGDYNQGINGVRPISRLLRYHDPGVGLELELQRPMAVGEQAARQGADVHLLLHVFEVDRR